MNERRKTAGFFLILFCLDVIVPLLEKNAVLQTNGSGASFYLNLALQPWTWLALSFEACLFFVWLRILSRTELSFAYPVTSLSYPLTFIFARLIFQEHISAHGWMGIMLISSGVFLLSWGEFRQGCSQPNCEKENKADVR